MVLKIVLFNHFFKLQNHSAMRIIFFLNTGTFMFPYFRKIRIAKKLQNPHRYIKMDTGKLCGFVIYVCKYRSSPYKY